MASRFNVSGWMYALAAPICLVAAVLVLADDPPATPAAGDPYAVADGVTEADLESQFQQLIVTYNSQLDTGASAEECVAHLRGICRFTQQVQDPTRQVSEQLLNDAFQVEYQVLHELANQYADPDAPAQLEAFASRLESDERPVAQDLLAVIRVTEKIQQMETMSPEERASFIDEIAMGLGGPELDENAIGFAQMVGQQMEFVAPEEAAGVYELFAKYLSEKSDPFSAQMAQAFQGRANFLGLMGNEMAFTGTTSDGQPFDIGSFAGQDKVVLVDFWATWCIPCVAELPNLKAHYEAYHGQGFEIVGISLDDDGDALKQFLADHEIAWTTLLDFNEITGTSPIADQYGIQSIPACILIDQEGKVVSMNARGDELGRLLEELLGPPPAPPASE